jgi:hypothetical protein
VESIHKHQTRVSDPIAPLAIFRFHLKNETEEKQKMMMMKKKKKKENSNDKDNNNNNNNNNNNKQCNENWWHTTNMRRSMGNTKSSGDAEFNCTFFPELKLPSQR